MVAPQGTDEAAQLTCEAADLDESMENLEHMNDDSLVTESGDEQRDTAMTPEEEEELLSDHVEQAGIEESSGNDLSLSIMAPQLDVSASNAVCQKNIFFSEASRANCMTRKQNNCDSCSSFNVTFIIQVANKFVFTEKKKTKKTKQNNNP